MSASPPSATHERLASVAGAVVQAGFIAVPHVAARSLPSFTRFNDLLRRLHDNGVDRALVIGGDRRPASGALRICGGPAANGRLRATWLQCDRTRLPSRTASPDRPYYTLDTALQAKLRLVSRGGMRPWLVSQFCLEAEADRGHGGAPARERHRGAIAFGDCWPDQSAGALEIRASLRPGCLDPRTRHATQTQCGTCCSPRRPIRC